MARRFFLLLLILSFVPITACQKGEVTLVGAMYHHWWVPGRWSHSPLNHPYEPVLGHYDNANQDVIRQHIAWAKRAGINTLVLNFWITDRDWWWVQRNTDAVASVCDQEGMNYFFLIDGWFEFGGNQAYEIAWRVNARAAPYFSRPGYVKQDGKPVLFFWAAYGTECSLWEAVRSGIEGTSGPVFLTGDEVGCFDMWMIYNPYTSGCAENDYGCQIDRQQDLWKDRWEDRDPWAPTAMPGYDDHLVRPGNPIVALNPDFFRDSVNAALANAQNHKDGQRWLFVCSWSEWHEGSPIEPAQGFSPYPEIFLDVLKEELDSETGG
jgi:hypothetical protein